MARTLSTLLSLFALDADVDPDDPLSLVPPEALEADPASACPARYALVPPLEGRNGAFEATGQGRDFWLALPDRRYAGPRPLLVAFGGEGETGRSFVARAGLSAFVERGFVVAAPSDRGNGTTAPGWDALRSAADQDRRNPDLELFDALVSCLAAHLAIDRHRVYVAGHSSGGAMASHVLQRRSGLVAGGVLGSGYFTWTGPPGAPPLEETLALVTWGGETDLGPPRGPALRLAAELALATGFFAADPAVASARCSAEVGHAWLGAANGWMADLLLAHPSGLARPGALELPETPPGSGVSCSTEPLVVPGDEGIVCPAGERPRCRSGTCQRL